VTTIITIIAMAPNLTNYKRGQIVCTMLRNKQATIQDAADENDVPLATAGDVIKRAKDEGDVLARPKGGRPEMQSERDKRATVRTAMSGDVTQPLQEIVNEENLDMGVTTLRKTLKQEGIKRYKRIIAKNLTESNIRKRKRASEEAEDTNWGRVMFTDKTDSQKHDIGSNPGGVLRKKVEAGNPALMKAKNTTSYERIHVWAAIGHNYKSPLYKMPLKGGKTVRGIYQKAEHLNSEIYAKFITDTLGPCFHDFKMNHPRGAKVLLLEDNHGPRKVPESEAAKERLGIHTFPHPPQSPDLNPIEVCWHMLKSRMRAQDGMVKDFDTLFKLAQEVWAGITQKEINDQIAKVPIGTRWWQKRRVV
jgi:transposase